MILTGVKKKLLTDTIKYYVEVTDNKYDDFIFSLSKKTTNGGLEYGDWLAQKLFEVLKEEGITVSDCLENKDIINSAINAESSRQQGEFYTPEIWAAEGRKLMQEMLGDKWGEITVWDASCGTGNLMRNANYPPEKLYMSSLLQEDVDMVKGIFPENTTVFQLDFLNGIDLDEYNMMFSDNLPTSLRQKLENDEPIAFFMNPPYKVQKGDSTEVGRMMIAEGMSKCALDLFHQFVYRIISLKRHYNLTNLYMGLFSPITLYHSPMLEPLFNELKEEFMYDNGFIFDAGAFSGTSDSVGWVVSFVAFRPRREDDPKDFVLDLEAKEEINGELKVTGKRLVTTIDNNAHEWVKAKDVVVLDMQLPVASMFNTWNTEKTVLVPSNYLGYVMSSNYVLRATRRASITTLPNADNVVITEENFWRAVGSFASRRAYANKQTAFDNCQYYATPNESKEGYKQWLADALVVFLFDNTSHQASYRNLEFKGDVINLPNRLFPLSKEEVSAIVTDEVLINDLHTMDTDNKFLLEQIESVKHLFSPLAKEVFDLCMDILRKSLQGDERKNVAYASQTNTWDAGFIQVRYAKGLINSEDLEKYTYLISKLKTSLLDGVYEYGFMMNTAFEVTDKNSEELDEELEVEDEAISVSDIEQINNTQKVVKKGLFDEDLTIDLVSDAIDDIF